MEGLRRTFLLEALGRVEGLEEGEGRQKTTRVSSAKARNRSEKDEERGNLSLTP